MIVSPLLPSTMTSPSFPHVDDAGKDRIENLTHKAPKPSRITPFAPYTSYSVASELFFSHSGGSALPSTSCSPSGDILGGATRIGAPRFQLRM